MADTSSEKTTQSYNDYNANGQGVFSKIRQTAKRVLGITDDDDEEEKKKKKAPPKDAISAIADAFK